MNQQDDMTRNGLNLVQMGQTIDVQDLLDLDDSAPIGYESIRIKMDIEADASDEAIEELIGFAWEHFPVCNTVCRPVPVTVERVRVAQAVA